MKPKNVHLVVVGSIGIDTVATPWERREDVLGGSVSFACAAASFFTSVGMVGVVGDDFAESYIKAYRDFGIDLQGLQRAAGRTFRWSGVYDADMNNRRTLLTELNVFASFKPELPAPYRKAPFVFLGNIAPELQLHVLAQVESPKFVAADTMDLWINTARDALLKVIGSVDLITLNDSEARLLSGEHNIVKAARAIRAMGPEYVVIKKGEHGAMLFSEGGIAVVPAFPLESVIDPTGAGDTFAGGFMGALAEGGSVDPQALRRAMACGSVVASFGVEAFSLERLQRLSRRDIDQRLSVFRELLRLDA